MGFVHNIDKNNFEEDLKHKDMYLKWIFLTNGILNRTITYFKSIDFMSDFSFSIILEIILFLNSKIISRQKTCHEINCYDVLNMKFFL